MLINPIQLSIFYLRLEIRYYQRVNPVNTLSFQQQLTSIFLANLIILRLIFALKQLNRLVRYLIWLETLLRFRNYPFRSNYLTSFLIWSYFLIVFIVRTVYLLLEHSVEFKIIFVINTIGLTLDKRVNQRKINTSITSGYQMLPVNAFFIHLRLTAILRLNQISLSSNINIKKPLDLV